MAKQVIAAPVVSLGLDSSGFSQGMTKAIPQAKAAGAKIGSTLTAAMGGGGSLIGSLAAAAVPLNAALGIASMAANAARSVLSAPMTSLMSRESFLAEQRGMPLLEGSDAGYTGVFARLGAQWEELLGDMMVALDKAFDFRGWIEYARGMMAAVSSVLEVFLGPLKEVTQNPEHLEEMFRAGGEMLISAFEQGAKIFAEIYNVMVDVFNNGQDTFTDVYNSFIDLVNQISTIIPPWKDIQENAKTTSSLWDDTIDGLSVLFAALGELTGAISAETAQQLHDDVVAKQAKKRWAMENANKDEFFPELPEPKEKLEKIGAGWAADLANMARGFFWEKKFALEKNTAKDAASVSDKLIPIMERMQTSRLSSALTSDSTALVEAVTKASVAGPGQDLQQRVAMAAEEQVRIAQATKSVQERILEYYKASDAYKKAPKEFQLV